MISKEAKIYVAGHGGLAGSAIWRHLEQQGYTNLVGRRSFELDLRDRDATMDFFSDQRPECVIHAAAVVGGIGANMAHPVEILVDNMRIQLNLLEAADSFDVEHFLFLGSSCIYPKLAPQPLREDYLLSGHLEPTNDTYAITKIAGILHIRALRQQKGRRYIAAQPASLYGPGDNFDLEYGHVIPSMMRRMHEAKESQSPEFVVWGTGTPRREFLHSDDLASACLFLLEHYDDDSHINVGPGKDITVAELAHLIAEVVGYEGKLTFDTSRPDGTPRKVLDVSRLDALGWTPSISLKDGLTSMYQWYLANEKDLRLQRFRQRVTA
jgi:GDP-L-fucose synthase